MKMKKVNISYTKEVEVTVYAPEDMDDDAIERIAEEQAHRIDTDGWECEWETYLHVQKYAVTLPEEERVLTERETPLGYTVLSVVANGIFDRDDALVVSDDGDMLVQPEDAKWWQS